MRAYSKHEASYIFRTKDLDIMGLACSFGLLRLPKMPELKDRDRDKDQWNDAPVDVSLLSISPRIGFFITSIQWPTYAYADKAQEAKRLATLSSKSAQQTEKEQERRKAQREQQKKANTPWSTQAGKQEERDVRKEKKKAKKRWLKTQGETQGESGEAEAPKDTNGQKDRKRAREEDAEDSNADDDWSEMAREEKMAKKVRRGEVSKKAFNAEFGDL